MLPELSELAGFRRRGESLRPLHLRMPPESLQQLQRHAERLQTFPAALARVLLVRGLDQLDQEVAS
jgi:hypothetical protein